MADPTCLKGGFVCGTEVLLPADKSIYYKTQGELVGCNRLYCDACGSQICAVFGERLEFKPGETIWLQPKIDLVHVFDSATGKVLH